jgi:hypothetical protein
MSLALYPSRIRSTEVLGGSTLRPRLTVGAPDEPEIEYASSNKAGDEHDAPRSSLRSLTCTKVVPEHLDPQPQCRYGAKSYDDAESD